GFALREDGGRPVVERSAAWDERRRNWLTPGNHNLLRLTRILDSLRTLGLGPHADALLAALEGVYAEHAGVIGPRTVGFWRSAGR
ncbi:MAG TPA: opioid growth factor receptor-related protein, partial [Humisphaera sp.]